MTKGANSNPLGVRRKRRKEEKKKRKYKDWAFDQVKAQVKAQLSIDLATQVNATQGPSPFPIC
jgi:hypothetical protein